MSRYLIDVTRLVGRSLRGRIPTGIDRVGLAYIRHFGPRARAAITFGAKAVVLSERHSQAVFASLIASEPPAPLRRRLLIGALNSELLPEVAGQWFINTGHTGLHRRGYGAMLAKLRVRPVYVIHDLIPISHPQFCREPEAQRHQARMSTALTSGSALVCNSNATYEALAAFAAERNLPMPPTTIGLLASGTGAHDAPGRRTNSEVVAVPPVDRPYFLMLGTLEPRKNHLLILQVWQRLVLQFGSSAPRLVLIGQQGWECEHVLRLLQRAPALREQVTWLAGCSDAALSQWMAGARALLFPSFAEGFGLPVLEALERGIPVISADLPVYREFAGDRPEYLDPLDAAGWLAAVAAYSNPGDRRRQRRVEALSGYVGPSWVEHFTRVEELLVRIDERSDRTVRRVSPCGVAVPTT